MKTRFNEIMSILHEKIASDDICDLIMEMVQHNEHAEKMKDVYSDIIRCNNRILQRLFSNDPTCLSSVSCNQLYNCNCCRRHQHNKPLIGYNNVYEISSVSIITKPCVFNPNHKFDTNFEDNNEQDDEIHNYCGCSCRQLSRFVMRRHLMELGIFDQDL